MQTTANDSSAIKYLSGFDNYEQFKLILKKGPAAHELSYQSNELDFENELFVTLMKLRIAKHYDLSLDFGISHFIVARIVQTGINFMYFELSELDFWPTRKMIHVDAHFP